MKSLVSVVMITYGHEKYIEDAIRGVYNQKYNGPIELIIANDMSPDNTDEIIRIFIKKAPNNIHVRYTKHLENKGMMNNFQWALEQAEGKYIAICEGDDYWADPLKLQKQIDFLESNKDYSICIHNVDVIYENGIVPFLQDININTNDTTTIYDILKRNYIHTPSVVFKNNKDYPVWFETAYPGDWPLHIINATYGKIKFLKDCMAVYRVHKGGVHSTTGGQIEKSFATYINVISELEKKKLMEIADFAKKEYRRSYAGYYGFNRSTNINLNRFQKCNLILKDGNRNLRLLFWLPLIFNNKSSKILAFLSKFIPH